MTPQLARSRDRSRIWALMEPHVRDGETYALPRDMTETRGLGYWFADGHAVYAQEEAGDLVGTYYLRANQLGGGSQVANCAFMVAREAQGRGVGRRMGQHALRIAREQGFLAMQFNFVVSTNVRAVRLWQKLGFAIAGTLPLAFAHPRLGLVDALVMHRPLVGQSG